MSTVLRVPQRPLTGTGLTMPAIAFGAGPVSALMTDATARERQLATVQRALSLGVDWFDTAATYGNGISETSLGWAFCELDAIRTVRIGTKVRLAADQLNDIFGAVRASVETSLKRLGVGSVALLQLHNAITRHRGDEPTSITPVDVLRPGGVLEAFEQLRREGIVQHFGLTGLGYAESLREVLASNTWATMQVNLNLCNGSTESHPTGPALLAIRVFAGGALAGKPPSAHTHTTKFFPLPVYERDLRRAAAMRLMLPHELSLPEAAVRFAVHHASITSAIIGFGSPEEVEATARWSANGALQDDLIASLMSVGV